VALRIFRTALLLTGIGAIVVVLIAAANAMGVFGDETITAAAETEELKTKADELTAALEKVATATEKIRNARAGGLDGLRRELELMKARGDAAGAIQEKEEEIARAELRNLRAKGESLVEQINARRAAGIESAELEEQLADINKEGLDKRNAMEAGRLAFVRSQNEKAAADAKTAHEKRVKTDEELAKKLDEIRKRDQKAAADIALLKIRVDADALKEVAEDEKASFEDRLAASAAYYGKQIDAARFAANVEKAEVGKTATELALIDAQLGETVFNLTKDANRQKLALLKSAFDEETAVRLSGIDRISENTDSRQQDALNALTEQLRAGTITTEQYEEKKAKIQSRFEDERLQNTIDYFQEQIKEIEAAGEDTLEFQRKLNEAQKALNEKNTKDFEDEAKKKEAVQERLKDKLNELGREIYQTLYSFGQSAFQKDAQDVDAQIAALEKKGAAEKKEIEQSTQAAQDKQSKIAESEALTQARREQLEQRKRAIAIQSARFEKAANIGSIIGETTLAVMQVFSDKTVPLPAKFPLAAVVAGIGALQLARSIAAPLPQYYKGRKGGPAEFAITGERGRERIEHPDGTHYHTPDAPTLTWLPAGANVITHDEVMADARANTVRSTGGEDAQSQYMAAMTARYYEKGFDKVVEAINNKKEIHVKETHLNITERGIQKISMDGNAWIEYINASV
jgi:hypothetical protein